MVGRFGKGKGNGVYAAVVTRGKGVVENVGFPRHCCDTVESGESNDADCGAAGGGVGVAGARGCGYADRMVCPRVSEGGAINSGEGVVGESRGGDCTEQGEYP